MFCRNHLKNTSCDDGFLNKYYYQILLSFSHPEPFLLAVAIRALEGPWIRECWNQGRREWEGVGGVTPPLKTSCRQMKGFVGKRKIIYHKTLRSYIRFTVGQYWLIIKKNGTNSVNFVRNCVILWYLENFTPPLFKPPRYGPGWNLVKNVVPDSNHWLGRTYRFNMAAGCQHSIWAI
jgi:hypothetical protein